MWLGRLRDHDRDCDRGLQWMISRILAAAWIKYCKASVHAYVAPCARPLLLACTLCLVCVLSVRPYAFEYPRVLL